MSSQANLSIAKLAGFQQAQIGNGCGISSACAALNILFGSKLNSNEWSQKIDALPFPQILKMRLGKNGPTTPYQQANQLRWMAAENCLQPIQINIKSLTSEELIQSLSYPDQVTIITIGWILTTPPEITYGSAGRNLNAYGKQYGYHTMVFAAYDLTHISDDGVCRPWGFVNSWVEGGSELHWMSDPEFSIAWSIYTPLGKFRTSLVITRSEY